YGPLPVTVAGEPSTVQVGVAAMPLVASLAVTSIVTGLLMFQPFEPSALWLTEIVGSTVSIVTVSLSVLGLPALWSTVQLMAWLPSPETALFRAQGALGVTAGGEPSTGQVGAAARPLVASLAVTSIVTGLVMFQPFEPLALWLTEIDGSTVSIVTVSLSELGF